MLRSGTKLEGPKGNIEVESEMVKDKGRTPLPHESEFEKRREVEKEKETMSIPPKPYMPLSPFQKDLLGLS